MSDIPEYSSLSQLSYILDKDNLIRFCEYFGGLTIKVPTAKELETLVQTLLLYQYVHIENIEYEKALSMLSATPRSLAAIKAGYVKVCAAMSDYKINGCDNV